jgi:DNA-directed RNA polymerase specialized sigma subunit
MKKFSQVVVEHRSDDSYALLQADITRYIQKVKKSLSVDIQKIIYMTQKYNLTSSTQLDEIRNASKSGLKDLVDKYNIPINDLTSLWAMLKQAKKNIRLLPQYQSETERAEIEAGRLSMDDLTIDLETPQGRNAASKMYMPIVMKIVNDYVGKSKLDKASLMSAGLLAMTNAMNDWKREGKDGEKTVSFKTFLGERVRQQILRDIDTLGHTLSGTNWYATKNSTAGLLDAVSLDSTTSGDLDQSKYGALGVEDRPSADDSKL